MDYEKEQGNDTEVEGAKQGGTTAAGKEESGNHAELAHVLYFGLHYSPLHYAYLIVVLNPTSAVFWKQGDEKVIDDAFRERDPNRHCAMRGMSGRVSTRITVTVLNY